MRRSVGGDNNRAAVQMSAVTNEPRARSSFAMDRSVHQTPMYSHRRRRQHDGGACAVRAASCRLAAIL